MNAGKGAANEKWSSRFAFVMAAVGSAVGLGNLWRFPAEAGVNGGGAFVIFYIFCVILIGLPVLLSETLIGRAGQSSAIESMKNVARESGASPLWSLGASLGVVGSFLILTFYGVIAGWVIYYAGIFGNDVLSSLSSGTLSGGAFADLNAEEIQQILPTLHGNSTMMIAMQALFMAVTILVVARGVHGGIEKVAVWLMPSFFMLFLGVTGYSLLTGDAGRAFNFLFSFNASRLLDPAVQLSALGQALFSLSLGSAMMITYGAYASRDTNLAKTSGVIAAADTLVAVIAGLAIFPIVFAAGLSAGGGPTLLFATLPTAFQSMPFGSLIGLLFFIMVFFAALTSTVALLEAPVSWAVMRFNANRAMLAVTFGVLTFIIGAWASFSFNSQAKLFLFDFGIFAGQNVFGVLDKITSNVLLPLSALLVAIFVGWIADKRIVDEQNGLSGAPLIIWRFLIAWLCPLVIGVILITGFFPNILR